MVAGLHTQIDLFSTFYRVLNERVNDAIVIPHQNDRKWAKLILMKFGRNVYYKTLQLFFSFMFQNFNSKLVQV